MLDFNKLTITKEELSDKETIVIEELDVGSLTIDKNVFKDKFEGAISYNDYVSHVNVTDFWIDIFNDWKEQDILS